MRKPILQLFILMAGLACILYGFTNCGTPALNGPGAQRLASEHAIFKSNTLVLGKSTEFVDISHYIWQHFSLNTTTKIKFAPVSSNIVQMHSSTFSRDGQTAHALAQVQLKPQNLGMLQLKFYIEGQAQTPNNAKTFYVVVVDEQSLTYGGVKVQGPRYAMPGAVALYQLTQTGQTARAQRYSRPNWTGTRPNWYSRPSWHTGLGWNSCNRHSCSQRF